MKLESSHFHANCGCYYFLAGRGDNQSFGGGTHRSERERECGEGAPLYSPKWKPVCNEVNIASIDIAYSVVQWLDHDEPDHVVIFVFVCCVCVCLLRRLIFSENARIFSVNLVCHLFKRKSFIPIVFL